jgi:hypothetical protein
MCKKLVLEKHYSFELVSERSLTNLNIRKWVGFYNKMVKIGLLPRKYQSYTIDFKIRVLKSIAENNMSCERLVLNLIFQQNHNY